MPEALTTSTFGTKPIHHSILWLEKADSVLLTFYWHVTIWHTDDVPDLCKKACIEKDYNLSTMSQGSRKNSHDHKARRAASDLPSNQFFLEELSEDDIGYDADIEVVRPEYEDMDSGNEDDTHEDDESADSEDQLAHQLRGLYCDSSMVSSDTQQSLEKGRKRMSKDMEGSKAEGSIRMGRSDFEIMELSVHTDDKQSAKRQRRRLTRSKTAERIVRMISQHRAENASRSGADSSTLATSSSSIERPATPEMQDFEMTDVF